MNVPRLQKFCCGCPLSCGVQFISWLELVGSLAMINAHVYRLITGYGKDDLYDQYIKSNHYNYTESYLLFDRSFLRPDAFSDFANITLLVYEICCFISTIMLLIGYWKRIYHFFDIWVVVHMVGIPMLFGYNIRCIIELLTLSDYFNALYVLFAGVCAVLVNLYFILVIFNYRNKIIDGTRRPVAAATVQ